MADFSDSPDSGVLERDEIEVREPPLFQVILLNDDYTTMEFVVMVLESVFRKTPEEANSIMLAVHRSGRGVAGIYTKEIAETKVAIVHQFARQNEFPLKCTMEPA
ncbi:MAG: ATP-dependent Clp protease adapter ClpS [Bdellovibrionales bacterium]|nr:ATP-dependent Clp protease adapter ClpS [Bdellovibrionales bacterium]